MAFGAWAQRVLIVELSGEFQTLRVNSSCNFPAFTAKAVRRHHGVAMALGGTLGIILTRVNNSYSQNNLRYGAGVVFTFGQQ
jgi:hypothetical protein